MKYDKMLKEFNKAKTNYKNWLMIMMVYEKYLNQDLGEMPEAAFIA